MITTSLEKLERNPSMKASLTSTDLIVSSLVAGIVQVVPHVHLSHYTRVGCKKEFLSCRQESNTFLVVQESHEHGGKLYIPAQVVDPPY